MKGLIIVVLSLVFFSGSALADEFHTRLLLHGHNAVAESGLGVAGWVIAPNISGSPNKWITIAGPRYDGQGWNLEVMGGALTCDRTAKALADVRLELTPDLWNLPIYSWHNPQWIASGGWGTAYWYGQIDWVIPLGLGMVGVESENTINNDAADYSVGPHLFVPLGDHLVLVAAPQFHLDGDGDLTEFQFWTRAVINL